MHFSRLAASTAALALAVACGGGNNTPTAPTPVASTPTPTPAPTPSPTPTPATAEMLGVVRTQGTQAPVGGARVEVTVGPNQGMAASTDGNGFYILRGLAVGPISVRASHPAHETRDFPLLPLTASRSQDLLLRENPRTIDEVLTGSVSGGTPRCGPGSFNFENGPCVRFNLPITNSGRLEVRLQWDGGVNDLDLYVFQGGRLLVDSNNASRNEEFISTDVNGPVEVRVVYYSGSTVQPFRLLIRRPN